MGVKHRTAKSSVAEALVHTVANATQELVAAMEIAIIEDGRGALSDENRQKILVGVDLAIEGLQ